MTFLPIGAPEELASRPAWFRAVLDAHDRLTRRWPRSGIRLAGALGATANRLGLYGPSPGDLRQLLPDLPPEAARRAAPAIARRDVRNRAFDHLIISGGTRQASKLVRLDGARPLLALGSGRRGAVLLVAHIGGPIIAAGLALHLVGLTALLVRVARRGTAFPGFEVASLEGGEHQGAIVLRRALDRLRAGGLVVIAVDGGGGATSIPVTCCGRRLAFRRGAFALARLAQAPLVPLLFHWREGLAVDIEVCERLQVPATCPAGSPEEEAGLAQAAATWIEARVLQCPEDFGVGLLKDLLQAPRATWGRD